MEFDVENEMVVGAFPLSWDSKAPGNALSVEVSKTIQNASLRLSLRVEVSLSSLSLIKTSSYYVLVPLTFLLSTNSFCSPLFWSFKFGDFMNALVSKDAFQSMVLLKRNVNPLNFGSKGMVVFLLGSSIQFHSHFLLSNLQRSDAPTEQYRIPYGYNLRHLRRLYMDWLLGGCFEFVSCPHYLGEILIYFGFFLYFEMHVLMVLMNTWVVRALSLINQDYSLHLRF